MSNLMDKQIRVESRRHGWRLFEQVGEEPYQRKDGTMTTLLVWQGSCVKCGAPFTVKTPQIFGKTSTFERVHCEEHKPKRYRRRRASNEALSVKPVKPEGTGGLHSGGGLLS